MLETYHNIKVNKSNTNKQNKINMASWQLNKTHKERKSNKLNMTKKYSNNMENNKTLIIKYHTTI